MASFPNIIDSSMRSEFVSCPERFRNSFISNLAPKGANVHLVFGGAYAAALHAFRQSYYGPEYLGDFDTAQVAAAKALIEKWAGFEPESNSKKTLESCIACVESYLREYPPDRDVIKPLLAENGRPMTEFTFALPIPGSVHPETGDPMLYAGRMDMVGKFDAGGIYVLDDKTAGALGTYWSAQWKLRGQLTGYKWAVEQFGYHVDGVIVRGVAPLVREIKHQQVIQQRPKFLVDAWLMQLRLDVDRMVEYWNHYGPGVRWPQAFDHACADFGGCAFVELCCSPHPEIWIDEYFQPREWNPLTDEG